MADTAQEGYLALAKQTTQGTGVAPTTGVLAKSFGLQLRSDNVVGEPEIGGGRDVDRDNIIPGTYSVTGPIGLDARFDALGYLLLGAGFVEQGAPVAGTGVELGAYTHTFVPAGAGVSPTFLTVETAWGRNRVIRRFVDCLVNSLAFSVAANQAVGLTVDVVGLTEASQTTPAVPTFATPDPKGNYLGSTLTVTGFTSPFRFKDFNLTLANNIDTGQAVVGQRNLADIVPGARDVSLGGTIAMSTDTAASVVELYRAAAYNDKTATAPTLNDPVHVSAVATFGSGTRAGTATGTLRYGVSFSLPDIVLNAPALESSGAAVVDVPFTGRAFKGASPVSTITLVNRRATAY